MIFIKSFFLLIHITALLGFLTPFFLVGAGQLLFPHINQGQPVFFQGKIRGLKMIGQNFLRPEYFQGRPGSYDPLLSSSSNLAYINPELTKKIKAQKKSLQDFFTHNDLLTESASGLDPHIFSSSAEIQITRIALLRKIPENTLKDLILKKQQKPFFSEKAIINVLELNIALDENHPYSTKEP
jgi:K+-transporting ATPase ATPase C chain